MAKRKEFLEKLEHELMEWVCILVLFLGAVTLISTLVPAALVELGWWK